MKFNVITFKELLGKKFNIPSYQRGYRWEKENVEALLNDIQMFAHKKDKEPGEFYCLQPVVVKRNKVLSEQTGEDVYDLLDGQQRLTTLWLILNSPKFLTLWDAMDDKHKAPYTLQYESRKHLFQETVDSNSDPLKNIDLFYLKNAFSTINNWKGSPLDILNSIVPHNPIEKQDNVRIIWYEFNSEDDGKEDKQSSSIKVFSRLNYGKIALTDTELIKALILQSDIYPMDSSKHNRAVMKEHLFRIATEWDDIEKDLHDEQLWGMLTPENYNPTNHMELLLRFVADQIQAEKKYRIIDHQRRDFHIISNYLGINRNITPDKYAENVDNLWNRIRDAYHAIHNWYVNNDYYHLIGLIVLMQDSPNPIPLIKSIYDYYTCGQLDQAGFRLYLEKKIGEAIHIKEKTDESANDGKRLLHLDELKYGEHNARIIKILEALNIYLHLMTKHIDTRFNFKKFKEFKVTSLEHIHPQHLNFEDEVKYDDVRNWYDTIKMTVSANDEYSKNEQLSASLDRLARLLEDKEQFKNHVSLCQEYTEKIDAFFDEKAGMDGGHMHTLYNISLVDKDTNAALSNNLIDIKRSILQDREINVKTYVPIATRYVFNKHFSREVSDMKFWSNKDRKLYFSKVKEAYNYFTGKINNDGKSGK